MEARAGNMQVARRVFKYLMKHVPWYGPVYFEAYRFEEKREQYEEVNTLLCFYNILLLGCSVYVLVACMT